MSPARPQVPALPPPPPTSQIENGAPPERSRRLSLPSPMKPIDDPSNDQNTDEAPSVPASGRASKPDRARSTTRRPPFGSTAMYASCDPSGERATPVDSSGLKKEPLSGGAIVKRTAPAGLARGAPRNSSTAAAPRARPAAQAPASAHRRLRFAGFPATTVSATRDDPDEVSSAEARSSADWKRFPGRLSRHRATICESAGATASGGSESGGGSCLRMAVIVSADVAARNGFFPASSS